MKYFSVFFILLALSCSVGIPPSPGVEESLTEKPVIHKLKVLNTQLVNEDDQPVVLRGISYGWHNWWPRFYNEHTVKWLKDDWKANVVRVAMGVEPEGAYLDRPEWSKQKVMAVIDAALAEDLYVIIDWHSHNIVQEEAKVFFSEMAQKYGDKPNVIYEIFNEPEKQSWEEVKAYSIDIIKAIRAHDPDNIILIGSPNWSQDLHIVADDPIEGFDNLMYTLHFYAATHKKWLRDRADYAMEKGIPIFVSECASMLATGDGAIDHVSWQEWIDWMEDHKLSWALWSLADKNETCSMLLPTSSDKRKWTDKDLRPWGQMARDLLISKNR